MLHVLTWLWGDKFAPAYVAKAVAGVRRHLAQPHRIVILTDRRRDDLPAAVLQFDIPDKALLKLKGCFARLRIFDPAWQAHLGCRHGDRIANIDLDSVITGPLDPLFDRPEPFVIAQGGNYQPCRFNGALFMLRAGAHGEIWSSFTPERAAAAPWHDFPDDQGWLWHKLPDAAGWICGAESGVFVFGKPGWPRNSEALPQGARYVTFAGWRDPSKFMHLDWVRRHWQ